MDDLRNFSRGSLASAPSNSSYLGFSPRPKGKASAPSPLGWEGGRGVLMSSPEKYVEDLEIQLSCLRIFPPMAINLWGEGRGLRKGLMSLGIDNDALRLIPGCHKCSLKR